MYFLSVPNIQINYCIFYITSFYIDLNNKEVMQQNCLCFDTLLYFVYTRRRLTICSHIIRNMDHIIQKQRELHISCTDVKQEKKLFLRVWLIQARLMVFFKFSLDTTFLELLSIASTSFHIIFISFSFLYFLYICILFSFFILYFFFHFNHKLLLWEIFLVWFNGLFPLPYT